MVRIFIAGFEAKRNIKKEAKPFAKANPYNTLREKNKIFNHPAKMGPHDTIAEEPKPNRPRSRVKISRQSAEKVYGDTEAAETTTYRYVPSRTYPTYKSRDSQKNRIKEKPKFKIHNEFQTKWLINPHKDNAEYLSSTTERQKIDWFLESATEFTTEEIPPLELMKKETDDNNNKNDNTAGRPGNDGSVSNSNDKHKANKKEDTTTPSVDFATVFQPEMGLTSLFNLDSIKRKAPKKESNPVIPKKKLAEVNMEEQSTNRNSKKSTTLSYVVDKEGIPKPKKSGVKLLAPKPRIKLMTRKPTVIKTEEVESSSKHLYKDKGAIVAVNRERVLPPTEATIGPFVKTTTKSPISADRRKSIHRRMDRYKSQLGTTKAQVTTTTMSPLTSRSKERLGANNRRLPYMSKTRDQNTLDTKNRQINRHTGMK